jgi:hypothetical protein
VISLDLNMQQPGGRMELYTKQHGRLSAAELEVADRLLSDEIGRRRWYHTMDLGNGIVTPGRSDFTPQWDNIRGARDHLDYQGKTVLALGSWDGMWAFEAEALGASLIVATDCQTVDMVRGTTVIGTCCCRAKCSMAT